MTRTQKRDRVLALVRGWQEAVGLTGWQLHVLFPARIKEMASCESHPEYKTAILRFNLKRLPETDEELRELVAHELWHNHAEPLAQLAMRGARRSPERKEAIRQAEEFLVTTASRLLLDHLPEVP